MYVEEHTPAKTHDPPSNKLDVNVQNIKLIYWEGGQQQKKEKGDLHHFERNKEVVEKRFEKWIQFIEQQIRVTSAQ